MHSSNDEPVLIVTGPPGVGKTTTAGLLAARRLRAVHLESDSFFHFIRGGYIEPWKPESHEQNTAVMRIVAGAATGFTEAGYTTIIDGIISPRWFLGPVRDSLHAAGRQVAYAILRAPLSVCLSRASDRASGPPVDGAVVERLYEDFVALGALERHVIDTTSQSPDETAKTLAERLRADLLVA